MRLQAFLYLLMRDHVPVGTVYRVLKELQSKETVNDAGEFVCKFSSEQLAALAKEFADELCRE